MKRKKANRLTDNECPAPSGSQGKKKQFDKICGENAVNCHNQHIVKLLSFWHVFFFNFEVLCKSVSISSNCTHVFAIFGHNLLILFSILLTLLYFFLPLVPFGVVGRLKCLSAARRVACRSDIP